MTTSDMLRRLADMLDAQDPLTDDPLSVHLSVHCRTVAQFALVVAGTPFTPCERWVKACGSHVTVHPPAGILTDTPLDQPRVRSEREVRDLIAPRVL